LAEFSKEGCGSAVLPMVVVVVVVIVTGNEYELLYVNI
jgi:hypothetical protein